MAITNPSAVLFCNQRVRPAADKLAQAYYEAIAVVDEWYANNMGDLITVGGGTVDDGAATDGRHPIDGNTVLNLITRLSELKTDYTANSNAKLNTILAVAVNPVK